MAGSVLYSRASLVSWPSGAVLGDQRGLSALSSYPAGTIGPGTITVLHREGGKSSFPIAPYVKSPSGRARVQF